MASVERWVSVIEHRDWTGYRLVTVRTQALCGATWERVAGDYPDTRHCLTVAALRWRYLHHADCPRCARLRAMVEASRLLDQGYRVELRGPRDAVVRTPQGTVYRAHRNESGWACSCPATRACKHSRALEALTDPMTAPERSS